MRLEEIHDGFQDHARFCRESLIVETEQKQLVPMVLGPGQVRLRETIAKLRRRGRPVRIIYLKSRRIQATTGTAAEYFHDTAFRAGVHTVVMAHDATSTENIFRIYRRFHEQYRAFGGVIKLPPARVLSDRIYYEYGGEPESSFIQVHTAGQETFGRSFRIDNAHFSEFPYYQNPRSVLDSVMAATAKLPETTAIVEGTAKTIGDHFHKMWQAAVDSAAECEWFPLFMGWWEHPTNRMPLAVAADRFQGSLTREERELMAQFNLSLEQLAWRRWTIINDFHGDMQRFRREHPATAEEAFTASSRNRFSIPHIQRMPVVREAMCGELALEEVGAEKRVVFLPGEFGAMRIYRMPEKGAVYACGADPSGGANVAADGEEPDPDWACAQILDRSTCEQTAIVRARMMPGEFGRYVHKLVRFYNNAQVCLERTGAGVGSLEALLNCGYPASLIYHRAAQPDQDPQVRTDRIGWDTNPVSREQLISLLDELIRQQTIFVHDPMTQQELLTFVIKDNGKAEHQKGCHDDTVLALALTCIVLTRMPKPLPPQGQGPRPEVRPYGRRVESEGRGRIVRLR